MIKIDYKKRAEDLANDNIKLMDKNSSLNSENEELKKQLLQANVVGQSEQLFCSCGSRKVKTTSRSQCPNNRCSL
jgi:hypothetical protein